MFPFLVTLNLPIPINLVNDLVMHSMNWPPLLTKLPLDIPKFEGKFGENHTHDDVTYMAFIKLVNG